jgi:hypothetical protein
VDFKAMNKKFAYTVVRKGQRKMAQIKQFKTTGVMIATANF